MIDFLLGTAVLVLPKGNIALLAGIGAVKGAGNASGHLFHVLFRLHQLLQTSCVSYCTCFKLPPVRMIFLCNACIYCDLCFQPKACHTQLQVLSIT
jgi:hypothetical protein